MLNQISLGVENNIHVVSYQHKFSFIEKIFGEKLTYLKN